MSDSHGNYRVLEDIYMRNPDAYMFIHLGDGERELDRLALSYPTLNIMHCAGNCDAASLSPHTDIVMAGGKKLLFTHGHTYQVAYSTDRIVSMARQNGADILLFGHTHCRLNTYEDGLYILNPGSCSSPRDFSRPSYGYIDITAAGIVTNIVSL